MNKVILSALAALAAPPAGAAAQAGGDWRLQYRYEGGESWQLLGRAVTGVGDLDGDGSGEFAVGSPDADAYFVDAGRVDVYSGRTGLLVRSVAGHGPVSEFGYDLAAAGDVDRDGIPDLFVGARWDSSGFKIMAGSAHLYSGASGQELLKLYGEEESDWFGYAVSAGHDADGDGVPDLLVGAPSAQNSAGVGTGRAYLYSGASGALLQRWDGAAFDDFFGSDVALLPDLSGDGRADVAVSAIFADAGGWSNAGTVSVYDGASGALLRGYSGGYYENYGRFLDNAGDVDGDGYADLLVSSPYALMGGLYLGSVFLYSGASGALLWRWDGEADNDQFGWGLAGAGDSDGDQVPDVLVGARFADPQGRKDAGRAYLYSGASGALLRAFDGPAADAWYGYAVGGAGDSDGDGSSDLLIGAPFGDPPGLPNAGFAELYLRALYLYADADHISLSAGGTVNWQLRFPAGEAGMSYALLASGSGTGPSFLNGLEIPLTQDGVFRLFVRGLAPPAFRNPYGVLDGAGAAAVQLVLPPGSVASLLTYWFAAVSYAPPKLTRLASVALPLTVLP